MIFSILVCTVNERAALFAKLHAELLRQAEPYPGLVEVLYALDGKEISVGAKRQQLIERATGEYVAFIDDDDWIAPDYVDAILDAAVSAPDCIGMRIRVEGMTRKPQTAAASNRYTEWDSNKDGFDYVRTIYHKTPVRREHAIAIGYKDLRFAEDHDYSDRLKASGRLSYEVFVDKELYTYRFKNEPHKAKYGIA